MRISSIGTAVALAGSLGACASIGDGQPRYMPGQPAQRAETSRGQEDADAPAAVAGDLAAARAAIGREDILTQMAYWAGDYAEHPDDIESARGFAEALRRGGRYDRAIEVASEGTRRIGEDAQLVRTLGLAQLAAGHPRDALRPLALVARADPNDADARSALGVTLDQLGRFDQARQAYQEALALVPDDPRTLTNLGVSYLLTGEAEEAETVLRQAAALPNAPAEARQNLAVALGLQGKMDEAEAISRVDLPPAMAEENVAYLRGLFEDPRAAEEVQSALRR